MRLITVKAPVGQGKIIAEIAFEGGAQTVSVRQERQFSRNKEETEVDVVEVGTATPNAKEFIEHLMAAPFYDANSFSFSIRHPESLFGEEPPENETHPIVRPTTDVYQELWQFSKVTISLVFRVFLSAVLLSFGMVKDMLPLIIAGLLFLPYHHHMLAVGLGGVLREWRFLGQGFLAILVSTFFIVLAGATVAVFMEPPVKFEEFGSPLSGVILATAIGVAAAFAAVDDAGRRELIGLAATAHITIYPAWFGLKLIFGFDEGDKVQEHILTFCINISALTLAAGITFALIGLRGDGIRKFVRQKTGID